MFWSMWADLVSCSQTNNGNLPWWITDMRYIYTTLNFRCYFVLQRSIIHICEWHLVYRTSNSIGIFENIHLSLTAGCENISDVQQGWCYKCSCSIKVYVFMWSRSCHVKKYLGGSNPAVSKALKKVTKFDCGALDSPAADFNLITSQMQTRNVGWRPN